VFAIIAIAVVALGAVLGVFVWRRRRQSSKDATNASSNTRGTSAGGSIQFVPFTNAAKQARVESKGEVPKSAEMEEEKTGHSQTRKENVHVSQGDDVPDNSVKVFIYLNLVHPKLQECISF
jgi:FtsZ-interacting cell division protein ZipA